MIMFVGAGFIANGIFGEPVLEAVVRAFSVSLPFFTVMFMALQAAQGFQTMKHDTLVKDVQHPSLNLALILVTGSPWPRSGPPSRRPSHTGEKLEVRSPMDGVAA